VDQISSYLLLGFEGTVEDLLITFGLGGDAVPAVTTDTHDGDTYRRHTEETRRRDEEYRRKREELRAQLLTAVERVTGKPPPLDQSLKQLAGIARKSEGFDYDAALRDIAAIDGMRAAEAISGARAIEEQRAADELEQENAIRALLLLTIL
jgi:hypothetical protein